MSTLNGERFWIAFIVRFAFGFLFLFAALNIFFYYDTKDPPPEIPRPFGITSVDFTFVSRSLDGFATDMGGPYGNTWMNLKWGMWPAEAVPEKTGASPVAFDVGAEVVYWFLYAMPFIFLLLSLMLLTGLFYRFAMRFAAFYLVLLGLGKYVVGQHATTAQDFIYATILCVTLLVCAKPTKEASPEPY